MKKILLLAILYTLPFYSQQIIRGKIVDGSTKEPVKGVVAKVAGSTIYAATNKDGEFSLETSSSIVQLEIIKNGYEKEIISLSGKQELPLIIKIREKMTDIDAVAIYTGYQKLPKERLTGSFSTVDKALLNEQVGPTVLDRLANVGNSITVDRGTSSGRSQIMVRGLSTIQGPKSPLIILDNFPYEGSLDNINPNTVDNISILKDAAATSIWGARAANGVIVITTKKGSFNKAVKVEFSAVTTVSGKPDLNRLRTISSSDFIDAEIELFKRGFYNTAINSSSHPVLSPVVELLNKEKKGLITPDESARQIDELRHIDSRSQFKKYMYQPLENRQYYLGLSGGTDRLSWLSSVGYDDNSGYLGEKYSRITANLQNEYRVNNKLALSTGITYTNVMTQSGRSPFGSVTMKNGGAVPYMRLADSNGNPMVVPSIYSQSFKESLSNYGLADWNYYPLTDWAMDTKRSSNSEFIGNVALTYKIIDGLEAEVRYQYLRLASADNNLHDKYSFYARNYINRFAQITQDNTITLVVPEGAILDRKTAMADAQNLRGQVNYNKQWGSHAISAIFGAESRGSRTMVDQDRYYGFQPDHLNIGAVDYTSSYPLFTGGSEYIQKGYDLVERNTRYASLFSNASYTLNKKYTITGSVRRDASNLFGLKTNDRWNPFWSAGIAWNISRENLYHFRGLPQLTFRASYGFNGNINPAMVAVSTIAYDNQNSQYTGTAMARFDNYYNPDLRWETSKMINFGIDFSTADNRINGSLEYFTKKGSNLFGQQMLDATVGIDYLVSNVASSKGHGFDIEIKSLNMQGNLKWNTVLNISSYKDEVINYNLYNTLASSYIGNSSSVPITGVVGHPVYSIYAYKWAGLDPLNGDPRGYLNGEVSKDYINLTGTATSLEDLKFFGSAIPTFYGSFLNSWSYKNVTVDVGISFKMGYWFRRSSINYTSLFTDWRGHSDYKDRWLKPGDESFTDIPSNIYKTNSMRDSFYNGSSVLVEKGDHIRLNYINLSYQLPNTKSHPFSSMKIFVNLANIGLIWKANKHNIDPDYNLGDYTIRSPSTFSLGLQTTF
ncbi:TonB-linked outer membrane protein, SusC/RagA family [Epilithonimonas bovis DSM 19482]|uniref:TonB-linked outer membrane protein, SusC/RagA family n=1 Tax=Epilithonimonas bovis DSM 19482 TaxID=1121284 RepID=A0A1U7Q0T9_9FLAO|nr:SusC/RagA family TonB-linked outer membrane protein [Epilithonimonas bovis]SIT98030.1 TonB-linked outer membrane protein, SusC/RagA family [Epilithonimonas bovis DSM 19482]